MSSERISPEARNLNVPFQLCPIACVDHGTGPAILLWSSMLMDADMFSAQIEALSQHFRVLAVDPPGQGQSGAVGAHFSLDDCGDAAIAVLDAAGEETAMIAGNSWGGMVAINVAARYPDRCKAIAVMNSSAAPAPFAHHIEFGGMPLMVRLFGITRLLSAIATRSFLGTTAHRERPDLRAFIARKLGGLDRRSVVHIVRSVLLGRADQRGLLSQIKMPTLIIGGTEDRIFPPAGQHTMQQSIKGSRLLMVQAGHFAPLEAADEVSAALTQFAQECLAQ